MRSLTTAATGMLAQQLNVEVISNNIANLSTSGYKRKRAEFQDLLYQSMERVGSRSSDNGDITPAGVQIGVGVEAAAVYSITDQGNLQPTGNTYDMAINGKGYFQIDLPTGGTGYTRAGSFQLSPDGQLVTNDGYPVQPGITIPSDAVEVTINDSGEVLIKLDGQIELSNVGQLEISTFPNEGGLESIGQNLVLETEASGSPIVSVPGQPGFGKVLQGYVETSNVDVVKEITDMIQAQRAYEMNSKVIETSDQMMGTITNIR